ncbi:uncharacterized protein CCOS01_06996 [Colletotrichum costaricense]|uniref:DNA ligase D 3'-phosphoesterase domain-containing protein n=1 Tax=Colletotrichum costaricense TaxID=1209916 RepID=A0AAI9Z0M8_9PEZI|nr:uncharacterized protein CCOS01_06996 [Colletotrichum costaricense]KAK1529162.1 hypothetical protein CCOS01_06996 [Colletotrichum costaricense]
MASKRLPSASFIENPFIKKRNLEWSLDVPGPKTEDGGEGEESEPDDGLEVRDAAADDWPGRDVVAILDPPSREPEHGPETGSRIKREATTNLSAALESGVATQPDPAAHFFAHLARHTLSPYPADTPHLSADGDLRSLFLAHVGSRRGAHFVVHQHDHPIAGVHYDLRLQVNATSSVSWAVMYGLPGDASSKRLNRNATETRVHCLWNHVVEVGSRGTGSLVIWDCGWYEVLGRGGRRKGRGGPEVDPDSGGDDGEDEEEDDDGDGGMTEQDKLARAFAERKIRVSLHGSRLPEGYVLNLRLTKGEDAEGRRKSARAMGRPVRKRRRGGGGKQMKKKNEVVETSFDGESSEDRDEDVVPDPLDGGDRHGGDGYGGEGEENKLSAVEREIREVEDEFVRRTNAYRGAENSVGSVYQRRWYLSLDREACGFERRSVGGKRVWVLRDRDGGGDVNGQENEQGGSRKRDEVDESGRLRFPFYVRGPDVERSVVTGRRGDEVLSDEGVEGFVRRKGWRPVLN